MIVIIICFTKISLYIIYEEIILPIAERKMMMEYLKHEEAIKMFEEWQKINNKTLY